MKLEKADSLGERFALEYLKDMNATQAYLRIRPDVTPASAKTLGARLLTKVDVQQAITRLQAEQFDRLSIEDQAILRELALISFSNVEHYEVDRDGRLILADGVDHHAARAVASVKHKTTTYGEGEDARTEHTVEYKLWNKNDALKTLAEHKGLIKRDADQLPPGGRELRVRWVKE